MTTDLSQFKIQIFPDINDQPVAPTGSKAGNGSHLISKYNGLIDVVANTLNQLNPKWTIIPTDATSIYTASSNEHILSMAKADIQINLPESPEPGDWIAFINLITAYEVVDTSFLSANMGTIYFNYYSKPVMGDYNAIVSLPPSHEEVRLIYTDEVMGWVPSKLNIFTIEQQSS